MTLWHCCTRPKAEGNSASGYPQHLGCHSFDCCTERYEIFVYYPTQNLKEKLPDSQKCLITLHIVGWVIKINVVFQHCDY